MKKTEKQNTQIKLKKKINFNFIIYIGITIPQHSIASGILLSLNSFFFLNYGVWSTLLCSLACLTVTFYFMDQKEDEQKKQTENKK